MRSARARELLTRLTPRLLRAFSGAGDPDAAFSRFSTFFAGLSAGVQVLSLFEARPALLDLLARLFALAPLLSDKLARRPALLDALIEPRFLAPLAQDGPGARLADLTERLRDAEGFEAKLNVARRFQREEAFRISVQLLEGLADSGQAGAAHAELAEACVSAMTHVAIEEVERQHGPQPGAYAVFALGKFGGRELSDNADLDQMAVYDAPGEQQGLGAPEFYTRVTQRLISALSAPTEEGALYEIDTKLRPSGSKGPVAVRLSSFERYYAEEAWTWEMQALTRLRPVAGDAELGARAMAVAHAALARPRDEAKTLAEVADMRALMDRERAGKSMWDLKLAPGGFVDIEFIAQALQLTHAAATPNVLQSNTGSALDRLAEAGALDGARHARLTQAWRLWSDLQQNLRVCVAGNLAPEEAAAPLKTKIAALVGAESFEAAQAKIGETQSAVRADFVAIIGP
ncbi:MAG TPA: glutamine-synthetase adenylyltransferase, partial [Terricaulis sp.]|nr:glutamine-synthetase adenylyltransferase [Terricaulis sp.]